ncbi:MAG TPA: dienelactone hydrolase family protein [Ktedonobacteraceae bacterium]
MSESTALRQALLARLGPFPERIAPEVIFESRTELPDHTRVLISYLVEPGERITAWLLLPREQPPVEGWPAILAIHQHAGQFDLGKSEPAGISGNGAYGLELCLRGYVVLCPDQLCFEDRRPSEDRRAQNSALVGGAYERYEFTRRLLRGSSLQTKYLHDLSCSLDVLAALPETDSSRLGAIGHSLGGQEALWLSWFDERVKAAVSSCGFDLLTAIVEGEINHNFAAYVPGMLELCDTDALLASIAPRAFLLTAGENDSLFPIDGVHALAATAQQAYTSAGVPDRFRAIIFPGGHSFPDDVKSEAYAFLDRWLR